MQTSHSKQAVFTELLAIVRDEERTVLISSHQLSDLERFTDAVGILQKGRLLTEGTIGATVSPAPGWCPGAAHGVPVRKFRRIGWLYCLFASDYCSLPGPAAIPLYAGEGLFRCGSRG